MKRFYIVETKEARDILASHLKEWGQKFEVSGDVNGQKFRFDLDATEEIRCLINSINFL